MKHLLSIIKIYLKIPVGICSVILTLFVLYLTLVPRPLPEGMTGWFGADKIGHFIFFITLTTCYLIDVLRIKFPQEIDYKLLIAIVAFSILLSAGIELAQAYMNIGRTGSVADFIFDSLGVAAGYLLYKFWLREEITIQLKK